MATLSSSKKGMRSITRDRSPIAILADRSSIEMGERDIRVDDFLDDKLQTIADFEDLDALIANVEIQRLQLQDQLEIAKAKFANAREEADGHAISLLQKTELFQIQQDNIDKRLKIITASDTLDDAVQRFTGPMEKLRRVELAKSYVELLREVDDLTANAREYLPDNPKLSLKPYIQLKQLSLSLGRLQGPAEGAGVHLVTYVDKRVDNLWEEMKKIMTDDFETILRKIDWPSSVDDQALTGEWTDSFQKLLDFQTPEFMNSSEPVILLPMAVMAKPFIRQFKYHFMSSRPTNSNFTPDYFFQWTLDTVSKWEEFLYESMSLILATQFGDSELATNSLYINPVAAFINTLLPVLREKINDDVRSAAQEPQHLSEFILLLIKFDDNLRKQFQYDGGDPKNGWKGLTWEVLDTWFDRWLEVEKEFALGRYEDIMAAVDSRKIDYDSTGRGRTKPTYGATKVTDLLANVTKLYQRLRKFTNKLRFLIDIQLTILDEYHNRLKDSLELYQSMTSAVGRTLVHTKEQQAALEGTGSLESLCKVYGSSDHIINTLDDWSSELFFVDLWDTLQKRAKKAGGEDNLAGAMTFSDVKNSTSTSMGSDEDGGLFDETISAFKKRREHAGKLIVDALKYGFPTSFRSYLNKPQWLTIDDSEGGIDVSSLSVTAELDQPLETLRTNMAFLHKAVATAPFRRIWHEALNALQELLWNDILMRERFTTLGAAQFMRDLTAIWSIIDEYIPHGSNSALGMPRLKEAVQLLNLPVFEADGTMSVKQAYERVHIDNTQAKMVVEELGFTTLTHNQAMHILQLRVEASD